MYEEFTDFANLHSIEETCAMLVQMLSDHGAHYLCCERMTQLLKYKRTVMNRRMRMAQG